jgi:hypothetical protein
LRAKAAVGKIDQGDYLKVKWMASPPEIVGEFRRLICAVFTDGEGEAVVAAGHEGVQRPREVHQREEDAAHAELPEAARSAGQSAHAKRYIELPGKQQHHQRPSIW